MKFVLSSFVCFLVFFKVEAQHSQSYKHYVDAFVLKDSIIINDTYSNGLPKETGKKLIYVYDDYMYEFFAGSFVQYDKKGRVITDSQFDDYGNYLSYKYFDTEGNLLESIDVKSIDTNAKTVDAFMANSFKETKVLATKKVYRYSYKRCEYYLRKVGPIENFKKVGHWKFYDEQGMLEKEKSF
ncbi:hypothetical protein ACU8DI_10375 [Psychroserpens sp. BH13MA-6]